MANRDLDEPSDAEVIVAVLHGDVDRFEVLVRRYQAGLLRMALARLGDRQGAEDAVQDSLLAAFRSLRTYDSKYSFRTWLWAILLNECRRIYRRRKKRGPDQFEVRLRVEAISDGEARIEDDQVERMTVAEDLNRAICCLDRIPTSESEAIKLRFIGEMTYSDVAQLMGCSLATAKNRVRQGLEKLSRQLRSADQITRE